MTKLNNEIRALTIDELDVVSGGAAPTPVDQKGYGPARINTSPFGMTTPFDTTWALVGANGHP